MLQKFANIAQIKILVQALFKLGYFSLHIFYPYKVTAYISLQVLI